MAALILALVAHAAATSRAAPVVDLVKIAGTAEQARLTRTVEIAGREDASRLVTGWSCPEAFGQAADAVKGRWVDGDRGVLTLLAPSRRDRRIRIFAQPYTCVRCPTQTVDVTMNGRPLGRFTLARGAWSWHELPVPADIWVVGENELTFHMAYALSPYAEGIPDRRFLSAAFSRVDVQDLQGKARGAMRHGNEPPVVDEKAATILIRGEQALSFYVEAPPDAALVFDASRPEPAPVSDGFMLRVEGQEDRQDPELLLERAFGGIGQGSETHHSIDLGRYAGAPMRITFALWAGSAARAHGDAVLIGSPRIEGGAPDPLLPTWRAQFYGTRFELPVGVRSPLQSDRPNVVIYLMDALRARELGCYGSPEPVTPHIDRLSRQGVVLSESFSQAPNTPPSVKSILTGRYLPSTGHARLGGDAATSAEIFKSAGYRTAAFSNSPFVGQSIGTDRGFETLDESLYVRGETYAVTPPPKDYAGKLAAAFSSWLDGLPGGGQTPALLDTPFFAYFHSVHPHNPYTPLPPWNRLLVEPGSQGRYDGTTMTLLDIEHGRLAADPTAVGVYHRHLYQEDLAYNDFVIGRMRADLRRRGIAGETVLSLIADHGEEFLEHGGILHGYTAYDEMLHVPVLIVGGGRLPEGRVVSGMTQSVDLVPTLCDLASLALDPGMQGRTVLPVILGQDAAQPEVYASASSVPGILSVRTSRFKYALAPRGGNCETGPGMGNSIGRTRSLRYLYDLDQDPLEQHNLAAELPITCRFLERRLLSWLDTVEPSGGKKGQSEEAAFASQGMTYERCMQLAALGYIEASQCEACNCERYRHLWPRLRDDALVGHERKAAQDQVEKCPECQRLYEAWKAEQKDGS